MSDFGSFVANLNQMHTTVCQIRDVAKFQDLLADVRVSC